MVRVDRTEDPAAPLRFGAGRRDSLAGMRLFLAVPLEPEALARVADVAAELRRTLDAGDALRWADPAQQHITLHFLGQVPPPAATRLLSHLDEPLAQGAFDLELGGVGLFPPSGVPRVLWLAIERGRVELGRLHGELASRICDAGLPVEDRAFSPHVTLARLRGERRPARQLAAQLSAVMPATAGITGRVQHVTLFESDLTGPRPRYRVVKEVTLADARS